MPKAPPAASSSLYWKIRRWAAQLNRLAFRWSGGRIGTTFGGAPVLLLDHVGRRTGRTRTNPLIYLDDRAGLVVVASKGGGDTHPAWFHNLLAQPDTQVQLPGGTRRRVHARVAEQAERAALWPRLVRLFPAYAEMATFTSREIPVVVLES